MLGLIARLLAAREVFIVIRSVVRWLWPKVNGRNRRPHRAAAVETPKTDMGAEAEDGQVYAG
jgi:hypothetical protein